jgi:hypothetical protein
MTDGNPRRIIITDVLDHMQKKKHGKAGKAGVGGLTRKKAIFDRSFCARLINLYRKNQDTILAGVF